MCEFSSIRKYLKTTIHVKNWTLKQNVIPLFCCFCHYCRFMECVCILFIFVVVGTSLLFIVTSQRSLVAPQFFIVNFCYYSPILCYYALTLLNPLQCFVVMWCCSLASCHYCYYPIPHWCCIIVFCCWPLLLLLDALLLCIIVVLQCFIVVCGFPTPCCHCCFLAFCYYALLLFPVPRCFIIIVIQ